MKTNEPDLYSEDGFPLWTSPQFKILTDEEIQDIHNHNYGWDGDHSTLRFARAILRKAGEK